jgi:hypothetical protein
MYFRLPRSILNEHSGATSCAGCQSSVSATASDTASDSGTDIVQVFHYGDSTLKSGGTLVVDAVSIVESQALCSLCARYSIDSAARLCVLGT